MIQFDNVGSEEEESEPRGFVLLIDIAAIIACGALAMFAVLGMAVVVMSLTR